MVNLPQNCEMVQAKVHQKLALARISKNNYTWHDNNDEDINI